MKLKTALDLVPEKIQGLIKDYQEDLEQAWAKKEDSEDLTVTFSAKFFIHQGKNTCEVAMSFVKEKIKDKSNFTWNDNQPQLPFKQRVAGETGKGKGKKK